MGDSWTPEGPSPFVSYAQNREDVILDRALRDVTDGRYLDVGAGDPTRDSVTYALYERGWAGIVVEPVLARAAKLREARPRDVVIQAVITDDDASAEDVEVTACRLDDVLEDAGWGGVDIHVMVVDTGGAERGVLGSLDLRRWRPWVLVIHATRPLSPERTQDGWEELVVGHDYELCLFDGLSRFYVAAEKAAELRLPLSTPVNVLDHYVPHTLRVVEQERDETIAALRQRDEEQQASIVRWRDAALRAWSMSAQAAQAASDLDLSKQIEQHVNHVRSVDEELAAMRRTLSWRITRPLRRVRSVGRRTGAGH